MSLRKKIEASQKEIRVVTMSNIEFVLRLFAALTLSEKMVDCLYNQE